MLTVDKQEINLGTTTFGEEHMFFFTLKNEYNMTLTIEKIYPQCASCTKVRVEKTELAPGEESTITVIYTPGRLGKQTKSIIVQSSTVGVGRPDLVLKFKSTVNA